MKKYEAMFIIKPNLKEEEKTAVMKAIKEQVTKNHGVLSQDQIWAERRKLAYDLFPLGGQARGEKEGMYYLIYFEIDPLAVAALKSHYSLNENVLRSLILRIDEKKKG